ncbi:MAG: ATP-binding protein [Deltaproteobacteria bacterium]|nr:ATP-binding protein [Deltaproteobacteria bacterium]
MFKRWFSIGRDKSCLVIGPRRCGKTTFLKQTFADYEYVTFDDLDYLSWARKDPKGFIASLGKRAVIDEIQRAPELTVAVKYALDNLGARFIMTGSSSLGLLDSAADTLAGRIDIHSLPTACWGEDAGEAQHQIFIDSLSPVSIKEAQRLLSHALVYGQFPEVLTTQTDEAKHQLLNGYKNSYFTRDLMQLANIENLEGLLSVFHNLARSIGSHLEVSNFARESGMSHPTTKKYLNALNQSQLTFRLLGYQFGPAKRYIKAAKTYFCDNGVATGLGVQLTEGQRLENFVISELEKRRKLGFIECEQFYYYKSAAGREIDLIYESRGVLHAVEIKSTARPGRKDFRALREFRDGTNRPVKCYLCYTGESFEVKDGIALIPAATLFRGK